MGLHFTSHTGFWCPRYTTTFVMVSSDHRRVVASAEAERRYFGGLPEPPIGSKLTEYTGPLCPISLRVVDPPFSRILFNEDT